MSSRVGGAVLALAAAALLAVPMVTSVALDAGGWWSGHPTVVMKDGSRQTISRKDVYVGFFSATGCNNGTDEKCASLTNKLPSGFAITALIEAALTGVAAIIALGLGITSLQGSNGRKVLAKLMAAALALSVIGGIALVLQGPTFIGNDAQIPFAWLGGFGMFLGSVLTAGIACVLAVKEPGPEKIKQPKVPRTKQVRASKPVPKDHRSNPHMPEPNLDQMFPPEQIPAGYAPTQYPDHHNQHNQPLFEQQPQLRPLYEAHGDMFPQAHQPHMPMRPPTPISREELGMMGEHHANPHAAIMEQRNGRSSSPPSTMPPPMPPPMPRAAQAMQAPLPPFDTAGSHPGYPQQPQQAPQEQAPSPHAHLFGHPEHPPMGSQPGAPLGRAASSPSLPPPLPNSTLPFGSAMPPPVPAAKPPTLPPSFPLPAPGITPDPEGIMLTTPFVQPSPPFEPPAELPVPAIVAGAATMPPGSLVASELPGMPNVASSGFAMELRTGSAAAPRPMVSLPGMTDAGLPNGHGHGVIGGSEGGASGTIGGDSGPVAAPAPAPPNATIGNLSGRSKPTTLPPPKPGPVLGNGPRPQVPMPRPTSLGTAVPRPSSGSIPPPLGAIPSPPNKGARSQATLSASVAPPPGIPPIPAPPVIPAIPSIPSIPSSAFAKSDASEGEDFESATMQNTSQGESTDDNGKPFESEEPVKALGDAQTEDSVEAKTVRARSTKIAKAIDDMHEAPTRRAPPGVGSDIHEAATAHKTKQAFGVDEDDDAKTIRAPSSKERASQKELGLSTADSTIQLDKEDPVESSAPIPGTAPPEQVQPPVVPQPPVVVPTLASMARALRQKRVAERQRERTNTNVKAVEAGAQQDDDGPIGPPSAVPAKHVTMSTAPTTLPPPVASQQQAAGPSPACPQCESPMAWVEEHLRFYCKSCRMYF